MKKKWGPALAVTIALAVGPALGPIIAFAGPGDSWSEAVQLKLGVKEQLGLGPTTVAPDCDKWFYLDVAAPSIIGIEIATQGPGPSGEEGKGNSLSMHLMFGDADDGRDDLTDLVGETTPIEVNSLKPPSAKTIPYKLMAGRYYLRAYQTDAYNCFGWVTLKSVTAAPARTEPKDNFNPTQGLSNAAIVPGKTYNGLINWKAKLPDGSYGQYAYNYFKYVVKDDNTTLKVTGSRADSSRPNNIEMQLRETTDYQFGENVLSLHMAASAVGYFNRIPAGTYLFVVVGWPADAYTTEYTFKIDELIGLNTVSLPKTRNLDKGKTVKLTPVITPANASNKAVTWKSSNAGIAKVDASGVVTGLKGGTAKITVTTADGAKTAECTVTVREAATKVTLNKSKARLKVGKKLTLKAKKFTPGTAFPKALTWKSSKAAVAKVDKKGRVTAVKRGTATITGKTWNGKVARCKITVT
ncbi:MAG: Ig-like domain-containing protein [Micrococcales bacterium]|nr:Ig-like domain-containing protein [Micrococcales bacterium]